MADNRTMAQMLQAPIEGYEDAIVVPPINANNFELKQTLINLVQSNQFTGRQDPHNHLRFFNKVTSTFRHLEVPNTTIKLLLFPFSLEGEARIYVAQVANAACNYKILHERDDDDAERPDKRQKSGDRHHPTSQQSSHRNHDHNNDRHGSDRRGGGDNHRSSNNNYSGNNNRETGVSSLTDMPVLVLSSPRVPLRATPTRFALRVDAYTQESVVELLADKKPGASGRVFAITEDHATKTSGTITGTLFIYGHAVFVLFDTAATHSFISSVFASRVTTTPTLLDHVLCISTPMQDFVRITHVYRNLPLQFDDKIRAINAFPLDMARFDFLGFSSYCLRSVRHFFASFFMGVNNHSSFYSKEDQTQKISKSVFVTNFPEHFTARDL
nr:reverse transcriptase domain-containing protein [Tanacetum cinerariifolium]